MHHVLIEFLRGPDRFAILLELHALGPFCILMITRKHFVLILWTEGAVFHLFDLLLDFPLLLNYLVLLLFELTLEVQSVMNGVGLPLVLYLVLN